MRRIITYQINKAGEGRKISGFLAQKGYSRQNLTDLKQRADAVMVNGNPVRLQSMLREGDALQIMICEEETSAQIIPADLPVPIVYEDEDILIVDKPAGMPIHPTHGNPDNTLGNALVAVFAARGEAFVYRCINRLDRDTSGLTMIAKHSVSAAVLGRQLNGHEMMQREYVAVTEGYFAEKEGCIEEPLAPIPGDVLKMGVDRENGQRAVTKYKILGEKSGKSLVACTLLTGKTHQIRVHLAHLGHPLLGDYLYHPAYHENQIDRREDEEAGAQQGDQAHMIDRTMLHAGKLTFVHPITEKPMQVRSPMPEDMRRVWGDSF